MSNRILTAAVVVAGGVSVAAGDGIGFTPYLSVSDSPLLGLPGFTVETFEDGLLNTPGLSASGGIVVGPGFTTDSVDGDDGLIDGLGQQGSSWYSNQTLTSFTFSFDAVVLGGLPQAAGLVWTDVGSVIGGTPGVGEFEFEAFGPGGVSLGSIGPTSLGDGSVAGGTGEDRFVGWTDLGGISAIEIRTSQSVDWEVDHVQFAFVPAPGVAGVLVLGAAWAGRRRR